jgi:HSP20 family molecular chaperone IbpA
LTTVVLTVMVKKLDFKTYVTMFDLLLFERLFPSYGGYRIPMWSNWQETSEGVVLEIAIPGYDKKDFELYYDHDGFHLKIDNPKRTLHYSILNVLEASEFNIEDAKAEYKKGVLQISVPRSEESKKKLVKIEVS